MLDHDHPLLLASASPRRREIIATLGLPLRVVAVDVDEARRRDERPFPYLERVTAAKLEAALALPEARVAGAVLVADTIVCVDGSVLGKPADEVDARRMLTLLSGRSHEVSTRFALATGGADGAPCHAETVTTTVVFRPLDDATIAAYAASGEGLDKAGAYAIQGLGGFAVERIEGSYPNVVGLPACELVEALRATGLLPRFPLPPRAP